MSERQGAGCWAKGCLILFVLLLIFVGLGIWAGRQTIAWLRSFTSAEPAEIPTLSVSDQEYAELRERVGSFAGAMERDVAASLALGERDLNALVAKHRDWEALKGKVFMRVPGDQMTLDASIPLRGVPFFSDRHLNGQLHISPSIDNGELRLNLRRVVVAGRDVPNQITGDFEREFLKGVATDPDFAKARETIRKIRSLRIEGDRIVIESRGSP